jgi:2,4-dienoyl-CoA reductase-like NADH-dependent reductase (Old Yellow Enzyme family)/thioredoxin reductase
MPNEHYPNLFEPILIGPIQVRNRLYMTPHGLGYAMPNPQMPGWSVPSERHVEYYAERARGGVGLIIQESTVPHESSEGSAFGYQTATVAAAFDPSCIPYFKRVADAVHLNGAKIFVQLWHGGHHADPRWEIGGPRRPLLSSSDTPAVESGAVPRAMTAAEIQNVIEGFARSTQNVMAASYDGVEIQAAHSALVEQFLSPFYNTRTDAYGGSFQNRLRFLLEIIESVSGVAKGRIAVGLRLNTDELLPGGLSAEDLFDIAKALDETGKVDFIDLDIGTMHTAPLMIASSFVPPLPAEEFIENIRPAITRAVVLGCPGRMTDPADAERLIAEGKMDMVGAARAYIAEPEFARNAQLGQSHRSRRCIACNHCLEGILAGVNCVINPTTGREKVWGSQIVAEKRPQKRITIVGGGPAGMEAARVAANAGHRVTLFESENSLGGGLRLLSLLPGREDASVAVDWFSEQLTTAGVEVRLGTQATPGVISESKPDVCIIATGSKFDRTGATGFISAEIPGWQMPHVYTPERYLAERPTCNGKAVVLDEDGQAVGVGMAELLAENGATVQLITRWQLPAPRLQANGQFAFVLTRLYASDVSLRPNTYLKEIGAESVTVFNIFTNVEQRIEGVDLVVLAGSRRSAILAEHGRLPVTMVHVIGDAACPRSLFEACYEGHRVARQI